jgi:PDZ domain-containing protein
MKTKFKFKVKYLIIAAVTLIILGCAVIPTHYYIEQPGETIDLSSMITVDGKKDKQSGSFNLTSVGVYQATVFELGLAKIRPFHEIITQEDLMGNATDEEYNRINQYYMESSQNSAIEQALKLAKVPYQMLFKGVYVLAVEKNSNFAGKVAVGDTVTKIDGQSFESSQAFMNYVKAQKVGQKVTVTYQHDGQEKTATEKLIKLSTDNKAGIGIGLTDHTEVKTAKKIKIASGSIGGPSAGMMFTLEIYEQLTGNNLRAGKKIAGTGTMETDGSVGRIGGIDKKVASASESGAKVFFAPDDTLDKATKKANPGIQSNYKEAQAAAKKLKTSMKIVPVKTVQDAIDYLNQMDK